MNGLVGYASSDDEDVDEPQPPRPAKVPKLEEQAPALDEASGEDPPLSQSEAVQEAAIEPPPTAKTEDTASTQPIGPSRGPSAPVQGEPRLSGPNIDDSEAHAIDPYVLERQRVRDLTMPTVPNFDIPDSPPPPPQNSEEAAALAATTKKFEHFLELKKRGVHFNERLQNSSSLRNPALLDKLMDFVGIGLEDSYASCLPEEVAVRTRWPEECYVDGLLRANERREKKRVSERDKLDFVPASKPSGEASKRKSDKR